jgi:hypothetical protein
LSRRYRRNDYAGAISFGMFLILIALFYIANPNLLSEVREFIRDFQLVPVSGNMFWLGPSTNHPILYNAAAEFCYIFGVVQVGVFALLFAGKSPIREKARTFSDIVFWLGLGYAFGMISIGTLAWISFVGAFIILVGLSIVIRSVILLFAFRRRP